MRAAGGAVNLEDEMIKVAANQMDYQTATTLYTPKSRADQNRHRQALTAQPIRSDIARRKSERVGQWIS